MIKTLLICHDDDALNRVGLARWLASFSELTGVLVLRERNERKWRRVRKEVERVGALRFLDVLSFRLYYRVLLSSADRRWEEDRLRELCLRYPQLSGRTQTLVTPSPNSREAEEFVRRLAPDIMIARCKTLLAERIFTLPKTGTFVMHPGVCPEYRNAHGCFWALAKDDLQKVGMTLLRIDKGVDTGPVFGYYSYNYNEQKESHIIIQHRVVFDNLDAIRDKLIQIHEGRALPLDTTGRRSALWGQPWLTSYLRWKYKARRRSPAHAPHLAALS